MPSHKLAGKDSEEEKLKSFHFDVGDSTKGPIGMCGRVRAKSKKEALGILKRVLPDELQIARYCGAEGDEIEYVNVYFDTENIKLEDIGDAEEIEENADEKERRGANG
jgi:hypothetical protein